MKKQKYDIAAYVWPAYTGDELRTRMFWPEGYGEWQTVRQGGPVYDNYKWDERRRPLWGYVNEADPDVMEMEINAATRHGVNVFIYDWYWFDRRPFLEGCLNDGFLKAPNSKDMKFYLMWANHDANHLWNREMSDSAAYQTLIWQGRIDRAGFEQFSERIIEKYFKLDNYYTIDGCPVFMIYDLANFVFGLGGVENAKRAIDWFKDACIKRGLPGAHFQFCIRNPKTGSLSGVDGSRIEDFNDVLNKIGADSFSHYQFAQLVNAQQPYPDVIRDVKKEWDYMDANYDKTYYPHVSLGWDNNPRYTKIFRPKIMTECTPENVEKAFRMAKEYVDTHNLPAPLITVNSWNEWTETSYLEPDYLYGYGYLDVVKKVFLDEE